MKFISAFRKLLTRKKIKGYYEASQILTVDEKQSLIIGFAIFMIPLILSLLLMITN